MTTDSQTTDAGMQDVPSQGMIANNQISANNSTNFGGADQSIDQDQARSLDHLSESDMAYIKQLRNENANRRTRENELMQQLSGYDERFNQQNEQIDSFKNQMAQMLGIEDTVEPEEAAQHFQEQYESQQFNNAILTAAYEQGIPRDNLDYFEYMVSKEIEGNGELSEESFNNIVQRAKSMGTQNQQQQSSVGGFNQATQGGMTAVPQGRK